MKVNILGTEYTVIEQTEKENPKMADNYGICEQYARKIIVYPLELIKNEKDVVDNVEEFHKKVIRHEVIHAFFGESGLQSNSDYAENEELIDWMAIQFPKILKVFEELGVIE